MFPIKHRSIVRHCPKTDGNYSVKIERCVCSLENHPSPNTVIGTCVSDAILLLRAAPLASPPPLPGLDAATCGDLTFDHTEGCIRRYRVVLSAADAYLDDEG